MPLVMGSAKYLDRESRYDPYTFDFIMPRLAVGAFFLDKEDLDALLKEGITHIINCNTYNKDEEFLPPDFPLLHCPTKDDGKEKEAAWFEAGIKFTKEALSKAGTKVYIHCAQGINRSPSMVYAILRTWGLSAYEAESLIIKKRPVVRSIFYKKTAETALIELGFIPPQA